MVLKYTCSFHEGMLSNLTCVLICSLTIYLEYGVKESCIKKFVLVAEKCIWDSLLKEVKLCRVSILFFIFLTKCSTKYHFLKIYQLFGLTNSTNLGSLNVNKEVINFECYYFDSESYSFFSSIWNKLAFLYVLSRSSPLRW